MAGNVRKVTTIQDLERDINQTKAEALKSAERGLKSCYKRLTSEERVKFSISPMYAPYIGDSMCVSINGYPIYIPVNGQQYEIPMSYYNIATEMIERIDDKIRVAERMADVSNNCEAYAGANRLISRA